MTWKVIGGLGVVAIVVGGTASAWGAGAGRAARSSAQPDGPNKATVRRYMAGFNRSDHAAILACLTEDVEWYIPGAFRIQGKAAFDKEIENDAFIGPPTVVVTRLVEEAGVVVAEGTVRSRRKDGGKLNAVFCDVFEMRKGKIRRLTSYLMELKG